MKNFLTLLLLLPLLLFNACEEEKVCKTVEPEVETDPEPLELTSWAPIGAKWYYSGECDFLDDVDPSEKPVQPEGCRTFYTIESVRDTIVQGHESRILQIKYHEKNKTTLLSEEVMRGTTKKVYHYNKEEEVFYLLYDFTKNEGDTIEVDSELFSPNGGDVEKVSFKSRIDSVFTYKEWGSDLIAYDVSLSIRKKDIVGNI